jgi:serine phosphatase RsbU (regulator of sigma subunit)/HAMP domain-containing protein
MARILSPLVSRLSVTQKLAAIYLLDLLVTASIVVSFVTDKAAQIDFSQKEREGTAIFTPARDLYRASVQAVFGDAGIQEFARVNAMFAATDGARQKHGADMGLDDQWSALTSAEREFDAADADTVGSKFTTFETKFDDFLAQVGDQSNLILDPDLDSFYSMDIMVVQMPDLLRTMQQLVMATSMPAGAEARAMRVASLVDEVRRLSGEIDHNLKVAASGNTDGSLVPAVQAAHDAFMHSLEQLELAADGSTEVTTVAQKAFSDGCDFWGATSVELDHLLLARVTKLYHETVTKLGVTLLLALGVLCAVIYIGRQITRPVHELVSLAENVGDRDARRATWSSADEFGSLIKAFNGMLDRLAEEGEQREEMAAQARAAVAQRDLLEAIAIPVVVSSLDGRTLLHANAAARQLFGPADGLAFLSEEQAASVTSRLMAGGAVDEMEVAGTDSDGTTTSLLVSARQVDYHGEKVALLSLTPINELKRIEGELRDAKEATEVTNAKLQRTTETLMSSLRYASRIQRSIFPDEHAVQQFGHEVEIWVEQRDIVGGDWHWIGRYPEGDLIFLCDCTGHGVPGALMTMLVAASFRRVVEDGDRRSPAQILMRLHKLVRSALTSEGGGVTVDDGLDAVCLFVERDSRVARIAGARLSTFVSGPDGVHEIKGDRTSIGYPSLPEDIHISEHTVPIGSRDLLYLFTDGLTDQMGGETRMLFGQRRLQAAIQELKSESPARQIELLRERLASYRHDQPMRDDASLMIIRLLPEAARYGFNRPMEAISA